MAKAPKAPETTSEGKVKGPETFKYTLGDLEQATGLKGASLRAGLRAEGMSKAGSKWGWNSKSDFDAVVKAFKGRADRAPAAVSKTGKSAKAEAPAAEAPATKAAKKAPAKKAA